MTVDSPRVGALTGAGAIAIWVGSYLPWAKVDPTLPPDAAIPMVGIPASSAGFEAVDLALLGVTGGVLLLHRAGSRAWLRSALTVLVGVGTALLCAYYLSTSSFIGFSALYVPAFGWYLVVAGGFLFTVAGGLRLASIQRRLGTAAAPKE